METNLIKIVYNELLCHIGEQNGIHAKELAAMFNITVRHLKRIIRYIRNSPDFEKVIGSTNKGYFVCTEADVKKANKRLYHSAYSLLMTARANSIKAGLNGQGRLLSGELLSEFCETLGIEETTAEEKQNEHNR